MGKSRAKKILSMLLVWFFLITSIMHVNDKINEAQIKSIINSLQSSTCYIEISYASGSGVYIGDGYVLTARHVVEDCNNYYIEFNSGIKLTSEKAYYGGDCDLGIILCNQLINVPVVEFADYNDLYVGQRVYVSGNPFGHHNVTFGIISGLNRKIEMFGNCFLMTVDAQAWPGNSGGPVIDEEGKLVGILVGGHHGYDGLSIVIPINAIRKFLKNADLDTYER